MQRLWWFAIGGVILLAGLLVVLGFAFFGRGDDGSDDAASEPCKPAEAEPAAGNANVRARALGKGYARQIVIRVTDKKSGEPVHGAKVSIQGTMDCPHFMPLYQKDLREASTGTYKGNYQLIMPGHWTFHIIVRSKQSGSTTASLPVTVQIPG
jgi:YtkA-like